MKIYIGGRISGLTPDEVFSYFDSTKTELEGMGYFVFSPMTSKNCLRTEFKDRALPPKGYKSPFSANHAIFERDKWCVQQCDVFYLNLMACCEDNFVSIGGVTELAWASLLGKHTVVSMQSDNIHQHAFVLEGADLVLPDHWDVIKYLQKLITQKG
jgi:hypothetical protein